MPRFLNKTTARAFAGEAVPELPPDIRRRARMRLQRVVAARTLADLLVPPSHHLKALSGNRKGSYSIRINDQWRICFRWTEHGAVDIEITDYH